ncbi:LOW QUALITY PROTEIN: mite group 2 allergen Pso o 2 [Dermatophagoides pteronyssinus]|uniref:LOW QUALITY PROTEIN: mite group 2 allergen Pso o 2 n=1 Tax=Dermatophagoides pteronyssinus TaxID=6956 RepID=UPI003F6620BA
MRRFHNITSIHFFFLFSQPPKKTIKMMKFLCIFALTFAVASAGKMKFIDCGHNEVKSLDVSGCEGDYCILHKGKTINLDMVCKSNQDSEHLKLVISADVNGIEIEVPGFDQDGCHYIQCPVHKGQQYDVKYSYTIPSVLPTSKPNLTAKVTGDQGLLGCLKLQGEIAD